MNAEQHANAEQIALWNGAAGHGWVDAQESLDRVLEPFQHRIVEAVAARRPQSVLDVGCGTGSTTLAVSRLLAKRSTAVGVDISEPMIALARARAERENAPPRFICTDAQTYAFEPASFDMIVSRFGTMFFDDSVRAFENLRRAAAKGAGLAVIVWRRAAENPFMTTAERAAAPFLPDMPARRPDEPGQFAFADRDRVHAILEKSGWSDIDIRPLDVECRLPLAELTTYLSKVGPASRAIQGLDERSRARVIETVRAAFDPFVHGAEVRFVAACWTVSARND
ncbi:MAG TPA: class I SAM-dependent methyltransferase [Gammaproteobacteria bacterium]|nr:class I SAM-dependent methyltransferase [Gammaproteobacteria bacterium]